MDKYIENLIQKFYDGKTSNAEEKELFAYFQQENIPPELEEHKEIFLYMGNGFIEEIRQLPPSTIGTERKKYMPVLKWALSVAAVILLVFTIKSFLNQPDMTGYEGSYMIKNGKKIYDPELIKQEERWIWEMSAAKEKEIQEIYEESDRKREEQYEILRKVYE